MKKLIVELSEVVATPATDVLDTVIERFTAALGGAAGLVVDRDRGTVAYQGGWWYRGEYEVSGEPGGGTRVTYRVYNVADRLRWAVPLANRFFIGFRENAREGFAALLRKAA
ncbi:hypothetical protein [Amycolatopsis taiwanensis]|uniref:hypothetical protein n=1 Tax=Amycolatopsis taiwanensis TaxID=342230 RepID=UPI0012EB1898|nr:hypothetical protein [Amycolatopsis taiwanensis]